ncbi:MULTISPECIES: ABC transporter permease [Methylomonas]|uniref:ABC transporter permease n=1 Tax=Methylomonas koyamae TaxID=702114 RepID=A0A177PG93_9GAMM|nr:FtsX-like permease family protein [Methylomonas koyamae]OAI29191.1 ABC transporter permease [Methylomonas koyamae]
MKRFRLAMKMLWRDGRSGELTLLVMALLIAVTSSTAIALFADRLQRTMTLQAAEFLAGDLAVAGPAAIDPAWLGKAGELGLAQSQTVEFPSMLLENGEMLLASIKATGGGYPLRGYLKTGDGAFDHLSEVHAGPEPGTVWVDKRVLQALKLEPGARLTVGEAVLTVTRVLGYEPDRRGDLYSFSPRVMMALADLAATGVVQPGSRVRFAYQFSGDETALNAYRDWLKPQLNPSQRLLDVRNDRPELDSALSRAERYLGLSSVVVILIAGVAIAMAAGRYTERHFNATALLRCLGCKQGEIVALYLGQFLMLGIVTSGSGALLGWLAQHGLFLMLRDLLPARVADPGWLAVGFGFATGLAILLGFALPPLLRLRRVAPLRVLRRDLEPMPASGWLIYGLALSVVGALIWRYTGDWKMTATILGIGALTLALLGLLLYGLLRAARRALPAMNLGWRMALRGLISHGPAGIGQILAFGVTLAAMALSFTVRSDLIAEWQKQLPDQAPNHFALNILPDQVGGFSGDIAGLGIAASPFYPVVRGRLIEINQEAVQRRVSKDSTGEAATQRELSLTWAEQLPEDNRVVAGDAWRGLAPGLVSVEQKLADNLGIHPGDRLSFTVGSERLTATVANLRSVRWDTMQPNFYMIFSPGTLTGFPATYMTSFYLDESQKSLLTGLVKRFPATTILEVDLLLKQFKTILTQLTRAIDVLLYFALAAGFTVLFAAVYASLDRRIRESALLRTLGAGRGFLRRGHWIEFAVLGGAAGVLAVIASEAVLFALYNRVMQIEYRPNFTLWLALPLIGMLGVGLAGFWGVRGVVRQAPLTVLRRMD